jgi:hypothetical protein
VREVGGRGPERGESEADFTPLGVNLVPNSRSLLPFSCWSRRRPFIIAAQVKVQLSRSQVARWPRAAGLVGRVYINVFFSSGPR